MWIVYSFITAFFETAKDVVGKKTSKKTNEYVSAFALQFFASLALLPFVLYEGIPQLDIYYFISIIGIVVLIPSWSLLYMKAIKESDLSMVIPMLAFNPIFTIIVGFIFERKIPSMIGFIGIVLIALGVYVLKFNGEEHKSLLAPIMNLRHEKGSLYMLGVALIWSVGAYNNKIGIEGSSPIFFSFSLTFIGSVVLGIIAKVKNNFSLASIRKDIKHFFSLGMFNGLSELSLMMAISIGFVPYVISLKRMSMVTSLMTGKLFFGESLSKTKVLGVLCMFVGVVMIIFR